MNECIFCKIINGEIPCKKIYEDENVLAFLDINPTTPGHTLVIPKNHTLDLQTISDETILDIITVAKKLSILVSEKLGADGYTLIQNNGISQDVKHFHLHIIPKYSKKINMDINCVYSKLIDKIKIS